MRGSTINYYLYLIYVYLGGIIGRGKSSNEMNLPLQQESKQQPLLSLLHCHDLHRLMIYFKSTRHMLVVARECSYHSCNKGTLLTIEWTEEKAGQGKSITIYMYIFI